MSTEHTKSWRKALLLPDATLHEAIRVLNDAALQIALVATPDDILIGTITDGDIRRGLLDGLDLQSPIDKIIHRDAFVVPPGMPRESVSQLMRANRLVQLPILDNERRLLGLHLWDEVIETPDRPNIMVIMAGGQGTRLRPHTEDCPKPLLKVGNKPMLQHILEQAKAEGFSRFVIALNYLGHMIEDYFGDGSGLDIRIDYLKESSPLGTAGALALLESIPEQPILVTNGDVLTDIRYGELLDFHYRHNAVGTMAVRLHEWQNPFGVVQTRGIAIVGFEEKPIVRSHINAGVYALSPVALRALAKGELCDMPALFEKLQSQGKRIVAYPMHEPWLDVGRPDDLEAANGQHKYRPHCKDVF